MTQYVIIPKYLYYRGGTGYSGASCQKAGIPRAKLYDDPTEALADALKLQSVHPKGWAVYPYRPPERHPNWL